MADNDSGATIFVFCEVYSNNSEPIKTDKIKFVVIIIIIAYYRSSAKKGLYNVI